MNTWKKLAIVSGASAVVVLAAIGYFYLIAQPSNLLAGILVILFLFGLLIWTPLAVKIGLWIGGRDKKTWNDAVAFTVNGMGSFVSDMVKITNSGRSIENMLQPTGYYPTTRIEDGSNGNGNVTRM